MDRAAAWNLMKDAQRVYVVNGRAVSEWRPSTSNKEEILNQVIGRSGNLRAPTIRKGDIFIVGYQEDLYQRLLGSAEP